MSGHFAALSIAPMLVLAQLPFQAGSQPDQNQRLARYSKPAIVRVVGVCAGTYEYKGRLHPFLTGSSGSGFFVDRNGYIVTNAHVVQLKAEGRKGCEDRLLKNLIKKMQDNAQYNDQKPVAAEEIKKNAKLLEEGFSYGSKVMLANGELLDFDIPAKGNPVFSEEEQSVGKDVAVIKIEVTDAPVLKLEENLDEVQPLEPVVVLGYPGTADNPSVLSEKSLSEASVFVGTVGSTSKALQNGSPVLQINVTAAPGSSGGPVLNQDGNVIGMITFGGVGENEETGVPYAVHSSTISEFTRRSGAAIEEGNTGPLYRDGLDLFWKGDYENAKVKFEAVKDLFQQHSEADKLIKECNQKIAEIRNDRTFIPLLAGVGVAIAGLLGAYFIVRRRPAPALANGYGDTGMSDRIADEPAPRSMQPMTYVSPQPQTATAVAAQPYLELKNPRGQSHVLYLRSESHRLGRDRGWADLQVPDEGWEVISKHHAILKKGPDGYRIYDGDRERRSTNGIWINGALIPDEGHLLRDGDRLQIGHEPHNQVTVTYVGGDRAASRFRSNSRGA